jgi:hypothetical protein
VLPRDNAGWVLASLVAAAVLLSASACGGESMDKTSGGSIAFRQPTVTSVSPAPATENPTSPAQTTVGTVVSTRPCGAREWIKVKGVLICLPMSATLHMLFVDPPAGSQYVGDIHFHVITRGNSEVRIGTESGEIAKWDVAPEDEDEFRSLILEPLEQAGQ